MYINIQFRVSVGARGIIMNLVQGFVEWASWVALWCMCIYSFSWTGKKIHNKYKGDSL